MMARREGVWPQPQELEHGGHKQGPDKAARSPADVNLCYGPEEKVCPEQGVAPQGRTQGEVW